MTGRGERLIDDSPSTLADSPDALTPDVVDGAGVIAGQVELEPVPLARTSGVQAAEERPTYIGAEIAK